MSYTKGYLQFLADRFKKCERRLKSVKPEELVKIKDEIMKGNEVIIKWVRSVLSIYEYDFKPDMKELEKYLYNEMFKSKKITKKI